jgi:uncharacterized repeat protein (TIGR01451 family)
MSRRPWTSWMGLMLLGGLLVLPWLREGATLAEAKPEPLQLAQGFRPSSLEPPLAPGITVSQGPAPVAAAEAPPAADPADPPAPHVTLRVRVPAFAAPGQELQYRFFVQNTSQSPAHHVRVRAPLPLNSTLVRTDPKPTEETPDLVWQLGTLAGGASKEISLVVKPTGAGDLQCIARIQFEHGELVRTRMTQPDLRVRFNAAPQALLYDHVTIQIDVTNMGQREATGVVLTNTLPDGLGFLNSKPSTNGNNPLTWNLGAIAPGKSQRVEYQALVEKTGALLNKAEVKDSAGVKQETSVQMVVGEPKLELSMVGPATRLVGRPTVYQITVGNPGSRPATNVEVVDEIPAGITFVSASTGGQLQGNSVRWKVGPLSPGAKQTVQVTLQAKEAGTFENIAVTTADRSLTAKAKSTTVFQGATGLTLEIDKNPDPLEVGKTGKYTLRVANKGNAAAENLVVTLEIPAELKVVEVKGDGKQDGGKITFTLNGLAPGGEATFTITAEALRAAEVRLRAELTEKNLTAGPIHFEETATLFGDSPPGQPPG